MINVESIACFYSENKATQIHTIDNRDYVLEDTLDKLESNLDPASFFRVSRKYYVNINAIKDIISYSNSRLKIILNSFNVMPKLTFLYSGIFLYFEMGNSARYQYQ